MAAHLVPVQNVQIDSHFWSQVQQGSREKVIPAIIRAQKSTGHWYCLTWKEGHNVKPHPFWDSDIFKVIEAACYSLVVHKDKDMLADVEEAVDMIRAAQHPDGYINSYYTVNGINKRWTNLRDMHEMYCLGHLFEACVAYETLTGSGRLLEPVMKAVRHVDGLFGAEPGKKRGYPGHQEIEIGLLRLYEMTKEPILMKLAKYFILERGQRDEAGETFFDHEAKARGGDPYDHMGSEMRTCYDTPRDYGYHQAEKPLEETTEVKGHSVRAIYFYKAASSLVRLTGGAKIKTALDRLWRDMVDHKLYVTGGLGAIRQWEGFGPAYFLGDCEDGGTCYAETCACFALVLWCQELLRLDLNSEYADVMEIGLYNGFLGSLGQDGASFYYQNPLRTRPGHPKLRDTWFDIACCPPNVAKLLGQLGTLIYSYQENLVAIHLFIESTVQVPGTDVIVSQTTDMPWSGEVIIKVEGTTGLAIRIPSWAEGYTCSAKGEMKAGYLYIPSATDTVVNLSFPLHPQKIFANPATGKDEVCLMRGPLVYCLEDVDNGDVNVDNVAFVDGPVSLGERIEIGPVHQAISINATGKELDTEGWSSLYGPKAWKYRAEEVKLVYVPYFLRANRGGDGGMRVWTKRLS
ncbi:DUF1680-domain-containing protein [Coniochaeta ligniaria NRRL 30616]|uniref:DUF1680-domain-containing protein n=1 Tax=Coniochaeta ligniaria NRRL 30616 TaxID=1408157 RepID=A0A1J7JKR4_9PEZI|nr:DUF1680-domain-containing protein [Coniochaeta ligniaria NRRL 30616]